MPLYKIGKVKLVEKKKTMDYKTHMLDVSAGKTNQKVNCRLDRVMIYSGHNFDLPSGWKMAQLTCQRQAITCLIVIAQLYFLANDSKLTLKL